MIILYNILAIEYEPDELQYDEGFWKYNFVTSGFMANSLQNPENLVTKRFWLFEYPSFRLYFMMDLIIIIVSYFHCPQASKFLVNVNFLTILFSDKLKLLV